MRTARLLTVSCRILRISATTHAPHPLQPCTPPANHACPPQQCTLPATAHAPSNHACPPTITHAPPQPRMPPTTMHAPRQPRTPPCNHARPLTTTHTPQQPVVYKVFENMPKHNCKNDLLGFQSEISRYDVDAHSINWHDWRPEDVVYGEEERQYEERSS